MAEEMMAAGLPTIDERYAGEPSAPVRYCWPAVPARNLVFLAIVLLHGLRRLLPPY